MGQPGAGHAASSTGEYIACAKQTRGTEPSKYPLEEKATAIPLVAASERGTAQTACMLKHARVVQAGLWGTFGQERKLAGESKIGAIAETVWKGRP